MTPNLWVIRTYDKGARLRVGSDFFYWRVNSGRRSLVITTGWILWIFKSLIFWPQMAILGNNHQNDSFEISLDSSYIWILWFSNFIQNGHFIEKNHKKGPFQNNPHLIFYRENSLYPWFLHFPQDWPLWIWKNINKKILGIHPINGS